MKTQISREAYREDRHYSGVYQQQGRMITDSDWNELVEILKSRVDLALLDVIGSGSPKLRPVKVQMVGNQPRLWPGTVYAGGIEATVDPAPGVAVFPYGLDQQKDFPSAPPLPPANTAYKVYADVWERTVVSLEDGLLRDAALHGADTCTRKQVVAQVKTCATAKDPKSFPVTGDALLTLQFPAGGQAGADPCDPQAQEVDPVGGDFLFRLEVHETRWPSGAGPAAPDRVVVKWSRENGAEQYAFDDAPDWFTTGPWIYELYDLDAEKHLGYHAPALANNQAWSPKHGSLVSTLPPNAPAGTMVRRWDGYLVLALTGQAWAVSNVQGETEDDTAPGAEVTFETVTHGENSRQAVRVTLADLELLLEIESKVFLPGDYWTAPVRRALYEAGGVLLDEAWPNGVLHRYLPLAEVQANNQLRPPTIDEQHQFAFPRLSELDAEDVKYGTTCTSGLFDTTHNTVEKALDRLCAIDATHVKFTKTCNTSVFQGSNPTTVAQALALLCNVTSNQIGYTTTCTSGLYDNTHNTVEKALNRLCSINATHVGFTKPADTSVYQGVNPTTVGQALNLLQDVKSQQISYSPASNPAVHEVKAALDELYARPVGNGARVYIGPAGQYATIDGAVADLLSKGKKDIALALLPGEHKIDVAWNPGNLTGVNLDILGLGRAARLHTQSVTIDHAASFRLQNALWILENNSSATFSFCGEVVLTGNVIEGSKLLNQGLIFLNQANRVVIEDNLIDSQWESLDPFVVNVLGLDAFENISDLFSVGATEFRARTLTMGQAIYPSATRVALGDGIISRANANGSLNTEERATYVAFGNKLKNIGGPADTQEGWTRTLEMLRYQLYTKNPGTSIVISLFSGPAVVRNNQIRGLIGMVQAAKSTTTLSDLTSQFLTYMQSGKFVFVNPASTLQVTGNVMAGIRGGDGLTGSLHGTILINAIFNFTGAFQVLDVTDNVIENEDNLFFAAEVNLHGNQFTPINQTILGWVVAQSGLYTDNRARWPNAAIYNGVPNPGGNTLAGSNLRIGVIS